MKRLTIGIIGWGRFAKILTRHLNKHLPQAQVMISSRRKQLSLPSTLKQVDLKTASRCSVVIPCIPISVFKPTIKKISPLLKPNSLVVDVCSVKSYPVKVMKKHLPENIHILATHPMWGPDSAKHSLKGLTTVLYPVRLPKSMLLKIKKGLQKLGQKVLIISPQKHDRLLSRSQAITHLFGRLNQQLNIKSTPLDTKGFKQLLKIQTYVTNDSWQLFSDMFHFNPYSKTILKELKISLNKIEKRLNL